MVRDLGINQTPKKEEDRGWIMIGTTPHINEEDENLGGRPRKKLRLIKEQSHILEESFIQNNTLTPVSIYINQFYGSVCFVYVKNKDDREK